MREGWEEGKEREDGKGGWGREDIVRRRVRRRRRGGGGMAQVRGFFLYMYFNLVHSIVLN